MIDPKQITPLLSNTTVDRKLAKGPSGDVYLVTRRVDNKKMALKHLSIPSSDSQTKALIYSGAVKNEAQAQRYYAAKVKDLKDELLLINNVKNGTNLLKFRGYQVDQKFIGSGYDVYLLSDYCPNLTDYIAAHPLTKLEALNLAIDLCSALEQLRSSGLIHKNVHPRNIFHGSSGFMIGDLGVEEISELAYSSMPDAMISDYTAPEVRDDGATLSENMDVYSIGIVLYEIYNGMSLPRTESGKFVRKVTKPLAEPEYADVAMSEIILRACAFDPDDRYESPSDMKQALVLYMQRGDASNEYLLPQPEPEPETEPEPQPEPEAAPTIDADQIAAAVIAAETAEARDLSNETEILSADVQEEPAEPEKPAVPFRSLNELGEDELLLPSSGEMTVEEFMASLRKNTGIEVMSMDSEGNMTAVPGYETEEELPDDTQFVDSADSPLAIMAGLEEIEQAAGELEFMNVPELEPAAEAPASNATADEIAAAVQDIVGPESTAAEPVLFEDALSAEPLMEDPLQLPLDGYEDAPAEYEDEANDEEYDEDAEEDIQPRRSRRKDKKEKKSKKEKKQKNDDVEVYDNGYEEYDEYDDDEYEKKGSTWKKVLITIIVLLVLAGGSFAFYTFKTDTVNLINSQVLSSTSVNILTDTKNDSALEVICSTPVGEIARVPYTADGAVFTDLNPNTTYTFTLASTDGKLLIGEKTIQAKTNEMTNLTGFAASSVSAVSATLALSGTGPVPENWVVTLTSPTGENITAESADIPIVVTGLTPETTYTATIARSDGDLLGGTTECSFTTMEYTVLAGFETTEISTTSTSIAWSFSGTVPESWTVTCEGTDGTSTSQEVAGTECTLDGLVSGETYTITLSCPSLKETEISTLEVKIPSVTVTEITSDTDEDGNIVVEWEYTSDIEPESWRVSYAYVTSTGDEVTPTTVSTEEATAVLEGLLPNTTYKISVVGADDFTVGGNAETTCQTGDAENFTDYGCSDAELSLYVLEDNADGLEVSSTEFTTEQHIAFALQVSYEATEEDKSVATTYVIRDSEGNPLKVYDSERNWSGTWTTARHTGDLPNPIAVPGDYALEVYFNGQFVASADFTVVE